MNRRLLNTLNFIVAIYTKNWCLHQSPFRENIRKRYLIHVAGYNSGLIMRLLTGAGTPRGFCQRWCQQV